MSEIDHIKDCSQYLGTLLNRRPELGRWLVDEGNLQRRYSPEELYESLKQAAHQADSYERLAADFRKLKQRHFLRIGGRDLLGYADLVETTGEVSDLAGAALQAGLEALLEHPRWWAGREEDGAWESLRGAHGLVVMGLGKLGGHELNYVSDVDLLFLSQWRSSSLHSQGSALLSRLCQWLSHLLADPVEGDRVFQVDLRLRPRGKDGPLAPSLSAAAEYYLLNGRLWERQMLLKARPVAGNRTLGQTFLGEVRSFVFRRFLDFQALDEMRLMRDRILKEAPRPKSGWKHFDVKLGRGGIREIEFLVQSLQLIYGGRHQELDEPHTLTCVSRLRHLGLLPDSVSDELRKAYVFLRRLEHWIQLDQNRQTQKLPQSAEARMRICRALGLQQEKELLERLEHHCNIVHGHFKALFGEKAQENAAEAEVGDAESLESWREAFPEAMDGLRARLEPFSSSLQQGVRKALKSYASLEDRELRGQILERLDDYLSQVRRRPGLVRLFQTPALWHETLCRGLVQSELISALLSRQPGLVEVLTSWPNECPDSSLWEEEGRRILARHQSYEESLEWIRRLRNERLLLMALGDLQGGLSRELLENWLTDLADFVIRRTFECVREERGLGDDLPLAVLASGRLGSRQMSYLSRLDLVFVHDPGENAGDRGIPEKAAKLIQRFMRMLTTPLQEGPGYSVDTAFRSTGSYGPLVVTLRSWLDYYAREAGVEEIQSLFSTRAVAGHWELGRRLEAEAAGFCFRPREKRRELSNLCPPEMEAVEEPVRENQGVVDLRLALTDLEYAVRGRQMVLSHQGEGLTEPDFGSLAEAAFKNWLSRDEAREILQARRALRCLEHRLELCTGAAVSWVDQEQFQAMKSLGMLSESHDQAAPEEWRQVVDWCRLLRRVRRSFCRECA